MFQAHALIEDFLKKNGQFERNVTWTNDDGVKCFGTLVYYGWANFQKELDKGFLPINDAVLPDVHLVEATKITCVPMGELNYDIDRNGFSAFFNDDFHRYIADEANKAKEFSRSLSGLKVGKLVSFFVADGRAYYVVTKINRKTVRLEWRNFSVDSYVEQVLGHDGLIDRETVEQIIRADESRDRMFSENATSQNTK